MGYLAKNGSKPPTFDDLRRAVIYGTVTASLNVEDFGVWRMANAKFEEIADRYRQMCEIAGI